MRRNENIILLTCLCFSLVSCKTVPAVPVVDQTQQVIERETITIKETAIDISDVVLEVEKAGAINAEQIEALKVKTGSLVLQSEMLVKIVKAQTDNINEMKQVQEAERVKMYEQSAMDTAEIKALTAERDRAIKAKSPWVRTAWTFILLFIIHILFDVLYIVIKIKNPFKK